VTTEILLRGKWARVTKYYLKTLGEEKKNVSKWTTEKLEERQ